MSENKPVRIALVVDDNKSYDDSSIQVVDVKKLLLVSKTNNIFLIETHPLSSECFSEGKIYTDGVVPPTRFSLPFDDICTLLSGFSSHRH